MKYLKMMIAAASLLAGSFAFGANDAVELNAAEMDQVTGEYYLVLLTWNGTTYVQQTIVTPEFGGNPAIHGRVEFIGGPNAGIVSSW